MMKVSICIPAYKHIDFLKRCINSVLEQDFLDYEVIITDDSPNNDLEKLVATYNDDRIHYYKNNPALGSPENWNAGLKRARGEYIKILHHDDWFASPQSLRQYISMLDNDQESDIAFSASCDIDENSNRKEHIATQSSLSEIKDNPNILFTGNRLGAPSVCIFRNKKEYLFDPKLKWVVDTEFYIRLIKARNNNFVYTTDILTNIGISQYQITQLCTADIKLVLTEKIYLYDKLQLETESYRYKRSLLRTLGREKIWSYKTLKKLLPDCNISLSPLDSAIAFYYFVKRKVHDVCCK